MRCEVRGGGQKWTKVANCGTRQHCVKAKCINNRKRGFSVSEAVEAKREVVEEREAEAEEVAEE